MSYHIGSFNVLNLSGNKGKQRDDSKAVAHIAKIVKNNKFDIVAFQEIKTHQALKEILKNLPQWEGIHASQFMENSKDNSQEYGFVWKKDRLTLVRDPYVYGEIKKRIDYIWQNHIHMQIRRIRETTNLEDSDLEDISSAQPSFLSVEEMKRRIIEQFKVALRRPPMVSCFRPAGCWGCLKWEFRIINTHITFIGGIEARIAEFKQIAGRMHTAINTLRFGDFRSVYTIVAGDYNLTINKLRDVGLDEQFIKECENHAMSTVQQLPTTLRDYDETRDPPLQGENCYSQDYDHFSYDKNRFLGIARNAIRVDFEDFKKHRTEISDHVPIYVDLCF